MYKINKNRYLFITIIAILCFYLTSCGIKPISYNNYDYFGSQLKAIIYGSSNDVEKWEKETENILKDIESKLDQSYINSDLFKFNNAKDNEKIEITKDTYFLLSQAKTIYNLTNGAYNPCVYYLVDLWGFSNVERENYYGRTWQGEGKESYLPLPSDDYVNKFIALSDFNKIEITENENKYFLEKKNTLITIGDTDYYTKLDLGGLIKGYAIDLIFAKAKEKNLTKGYLSYGTSSIVAGTNNNGQSFDLTLTNPRKLQESDNDIYLKTPIKNIFVSTSGDYEKYYFIENVRYSHLIDASTGYPINNNICCATVFCESAMLSDMLSTALCVMGKDKAIEFLKSYYAGKNNIKGLFAYENENKIEIYSTVENIEILDNNFELKEI